MNLTAIYRNDQTSVNLAAVNGHLAVFPRLCEHKADEEVRDNEYGMTPLNWAARFDRLPVV